MKHLRCRRFTHIENNMLGLVATIENKTFVGKGCQKITFVTKWELSVNKMVLFHPPRFDLVRLFFRRPTRIDIG